MTLITRFATMLAAMLWWAQVALADDITISSARARASLTLTTTTGAVYFTISNAGKVDDTLLAVTTPAASSAMIHETTLVDDVMKMRMADGGLVIPAASKVEMKPGGTHVMLMGMKAPLKQGETVAVELVFQNAGVVKLEVPVQGVAAQ